MLFKPPEEFLMGKQHLLGLGTVSVVFIPKPDMGVIDFKDAVSGDGYFVGISSEIFHYPVRRTEGSLGIHVPLFEPDVFEYVFFVSIPVDETIPFQTFHKHCFEHTCQTFLWKKEAVVFALCIYPSFAVKASGTDDAMNMGVKT